MARVSIDILGISGLKWTGMGEFNSADHYIYYWGQGSLRRNGVAFTVNKNPKCSTWVQSQKWQMISVRFQEKPFSITVIQVCAPTSSAKAAEVEQFYEDLQDFLELTPPKDVLFIIGDCNIEAGSQEITCSTGKFGLGVQNEAGQKLTVLPSEHTGHGKHPLLQHKRRLYTWTSPDGQHQNQIDCILCSQRWRSSLQSAKTRLTILMIWADCGSDHEFLIGKFSLKLNKVGKARRPFRYDLNQISYIYPVDVTNRFKGLDLIDSAWRTMDRGLWHCTGGSDQDHPQEKYVKAKWLSEEALQIAEKRREVKSKGEKEKYSHLNKEFLRTAQKHKKAFLSDQCKEIEENNRMGKTRSLQEN